MNKYITKWFYTYRYTSYLPIYLEDAGGGECQDKLGESFKIYPHENDSTLPKTDVYSYTQLPSNLSSLSCVGMIRHRKRSDMIHQTTSSTNHPPIPSISILTLMHAKDRYQ